MPDNESETAGSAMPIYDASVINDPDVQWTRLRERLPDNSGQQLEPAFQLASRIHAGQWRRKAEGAARVPYIVHPLRVSRIVSEEWRRAEIPILASCLLHDTLEDSPLTLRSDLEEEIRQSVGTEVLAAVRTLSKPHLPEPCPEDVKAARDARYFSQLRAAPDWVRLIKCADRVDNLRDARSWGNRAFWARYCSETIGWHLFLARETAAIAEVALFRELVAGEREIRGRVPLWADGYLVDPMAAALVPEHIARNYGVVGLALQGDTLMVGIKRGANKNASEALHNVTGKQIEILMLSTDAVRDVLDAGLYGKTEDGQV